MPMTTAELEDFWVRAYPFLEAYRAMCISGPAMPGTSRHTAWNRMRRSPALIRAGAPAIVSVNNDTLYCTAWLDLRAGPVRLRVPKVPGQRYWSVQFIDPRTENVAVLGPRCGRDEPGEYFVCASAQEAPAGARTVALGSTIAFMIVRIVLYGEHDLPAVHALQQGFDLEPPGADAYAAAPGAPELPAPSQAPVREWRPEDALAITRAMVAQLPPDAERARMELDCARMRQALAAAPVIVGAAFGAAVRGIEAQAEAIGSGIDGWDYWPGHIGTWGEDWPLRAAIACKALFALSPDEAVYVTANGDADGRPLDGRSGCVLRFAAGALPPVRFFWSLTLYNGKGLLHENPLGRQSLGDRSPGLVRGDDGSLSLHASHVCPDGVPASNWLPAPAGPMYLILRGYGPLQAWGRGGYLLPPVQRLDTTTPS